jgi:hypothetical protein
MRYLGDLQNEGYLRSQQSNEMLTTAKLGPVIYRVIADSIINRNLDESAKDWSEIKALSEKGWPMPLSWHETRMKRSG